MVLLLPPPSLRPATHLAVHDEVRSGAPLAHLDVVCLAEAHGARMPLLTRGAFQVCHDCVVLVVCGP